MNMESFGVSERITFPKRDYCKSCQGFTCFDEDVCYICKNPHKYLKGGFQ